MEYLINWLKNTFHADYNTIAGIVITLLTFVLGFFINEIFKSISKYRQRITYRKIIYININKLIDQVLIQSKSLKIVYESIKVDKEENLLFKYDNIPSLEVLKNIGYENTYRALFVGLENYFYKRYTRNQRLEALSLLWNEIEYLIGVQRNIVSDYDTFFEQHLQTDMDRQRYVRTVQDKIDEVLITSDYETISPPVVSFLLRYRELHSETFISNHILSPTEAHTYHQKLKTLFTSNIQTVIDFKDELKASEIIPLLHKSNDTFALLTNLTEKSKYSYFDTWNSYVKSHKKLIEIETILQNKKQNI